MLRVIICAFLLSLLTACATTGNTNKPSEQDPKVKTAKINAQLGIAYLERHNLQRAKQKLLLALEQAPNIPETWYSMAYFLEATGNKNDASIYYQKAISLAPTRGDAQNNYGTFLCRNGEYRESISHFMAAAKDTSYLDPAGAYENAGLCALKIPDSKVAAKYFSEAVAHDPSRIVSERKLSELNKYLAKNETTSATPFAAPKRIAYNSLRHQHDEDESEEESGLVKIPDLAKLKHASAAGSSSTYTPTEEISRPMAKLHHTSPQKVTTARLQHKGKTAFTPKEVAFNGKTKKKVASKLKSMKSTIQAEKASKIKVAAKPNKVKLNKRAVTAKLKSKSKVAAVRKKTRAPLEGTVTI